MYRSGMWPVQSLFPFNEFSTRFKPGFRMTRGCGAPWGNTPVVTAEGRIFSCIYLMGISRFKVGDIYSEGYPDERVIGQMLDAADVDNNDTCRSCSLRYLCGGGCPVGKFLIMGNPHVPAQVMNYTRRIAWPA
ncbi:MAG: SPASM domain-containing protein [Syntrophales bacterium]